MRHLPYGSVRHAARSVIDKHFRSAFVIEFFQRIYCSAECQKVDWPSHKLTCGMYCIGIGITDRVSQGMQGKTDKIELASFYPLLACLVEKSHIHPDKPVHSALLHQIVNSPNPNCVPVRFLDGWAGKPVILGEPISSSPGTEEWWPTSISPMVRCKLLRRILREGYVLPILTAVCIAVLAEIYTTTSGSSAAGNSEQRRARLRYKSSPIADFGIAMGSAEVTDQDKLAYFHLSDGTLLRGQDPDRHYWIYFTTVRGEEIILDCAMFTFNMCTMVNGTQAYLPQLAPVSSFAPAFFRDRVYRADTPELHAERKRLSVLRNEAFHQAIIRSTEGFSKNDMRVFRKYMEDLSGKSCTQKDEELLATYALSNCNVIGAVLEDSRWRKFPPAPEIAIEQDPGESVGSPDDGSEEWFKYLKRWKKQKKSGKVGDETLAQAFRSWKQRWSESRSTSGRH